MIFKIGVALAAVVIPVLVFPTGWVEHSMWFAVPRPLAILYGVQVSTVLVAYALASRRILRGGFRRISYGWVWPPTYSSNENVT